MRRLMLLRHAKTEGTTPSGEDSDRRLVPRGFADAHLIGRWMAEHDAVADLVLVSTAVRARQTWEAVAPLLAAHVPNAEVAYLDDLYLADPIDILQIIHGAADDDPARLLVVGHNPGLHELALGLTAEADESLRRALSHNLPTSALAVIDFAVDDWRDVSFRRGRLAAFVTPKLLSQSMQDN